MYQRPSIKLWVFMQHEISSITPSVLRPLESPNPERYAGIWFWYLMSRAPVCHSTQKRGLCSLNTAPPPKKTRFLTTTVPPTPGLDLFRVSPPAQARILRGRTGLDRPGCRVPICLPDQGFKGGAGGWGLSPPLSPYRRFLAGNRRDGGRPHGR